MWSGVQRQVVTGMRAEDGTLEGLKNKEKEWEGGAGDRLKKKNGKKTSCNEKNGGEKSKILQEKKKCEVREGQQERVS